MPLCFILVLLVSNRLQLCPLHPLSVNIFASPLQLPHIFANHTRLQLQLQPQPQLPRHSSISEIPRPPRSQGLVIILSLSHAFLFSCRSVRRRSSASEALNLKRHQEPCHPRETTSSPPLSSANPAFSPPLSRTRPLIFATEVATQAFLEA